MTTPPLDPSLFDLGDVLWAMHCAEAPIPGAAAEAVRRRLAWELRPWEQPLAEWLGLPARVRAQAARLLGVAVAGGTSSALTAAAQAFPWRPGDEVLVPLGEFPANVWPWKALAARGVALREAALWDGQRAGREAEAGTAPDVRVDPETRLLEAIGPRTHVLAVSWVRWPSLRAPSPRTSAPASPARRGGGTPCTRPT